MPVAPTSVLRALRIGVAENRSTALVAVACQLHRPFAELLVQEAIGGSEPGADTLRLNDLEASVEVAAVGGRVDLELVVHTSVGLRRIWLEVKGDAEFQDDQLGRYQRALAQTPGAQGRLVVLLPASRVHTPELAGIDVEAITWQTLAALADSAGSRVHDASGQAGYWRPSARQSDAPARQLVLDLLLEHLQEEYDVTIDPLTTLHASALRLASSAIAVSDRIAADAIVRAQCQTVRTEPWLKGLGCRWYLSPPVSTEQRWWEPNGEFVLWRSVSGNRGLHPAGGASFVAGAKLSPAAGEELHSLITRLCEQDARTDWPWPLRHLPQAKHHFVCSALPLEALATAAATPEHQVQFVSSWLLHTLASLEQSPPANS